MKEPTSIEDFPQDVQDFFYQITAQAIVRAERNGIEIKIPKGELPE